MTGMVVEGEGEGQGQVSPAQRGVDAQIGSGAARIHPLHGDSGAAVAKGIPGGAGGGLGAGGRGTFRAQCGVGQPVGRGELGGDDRGQAVRRRDNAGGQRGFGRQGRGGQVGRRWVLGADGERRGGAEDSEEEQNPKNHRFSHLCLTKRYSGFWVRVIGLCGGKKPKKPPRECG